MYGLPRQQSIWVIIFTFMTVPRLYENAQINMLDDAFWQTPIRRRTCSEQNKTKYQQMVLDRNSRFIHRFTHCLPLPSSAWEMLQLNAEANKHLWALRSQLHPLLHQAFDAGAFLPDGDLASNLKLLVLNEIAGSTDVRKPCVHTRHDEQCKAHGANWIWIRKLACPQSYMISDQSS